ncbi:MAG: glycosyltransferase family 2 protein [Candidatus Bathyarchaeia archaeon]
MQEILPSVAVIVPTYNRSLMLRRALESILTQNYPNIVKIVVTDDASTDDTKEIVKEYMNKDNRIVFIENTRYKKGPAGNKNNGLDYVEYIIKPDLFCFLDDDQVLLPNAISRLADLYRRYNGKYRIVFGNAVNERGEKITKVAKGLYEITYEDIICGRARDDSFGLIETSLLKGRRYCDDAWGAEWTLIAQIYKDNVTALYVDEDLLKIYEEHSDRVTFKMTEKADRQFLNYKYFLDIVEEDLKKICPRVLAKHSLSAALFAKLSGKKAEVNFYLKKALKASSHPKIITIALLILILPPRLLSALRGGKLYMGFFRKLLWR